MGRKTPSLKPRNRYAIHPLMAKGGCHQASNGAKRAAAKQALRAQMAKQPSADSAALCA